MVDFEFYRNGYLGSIIPEKQFSAVAGRAEAELKRLQRCYRVSSSGSDSENMAICAMAEALFRAQGRQGISTASVGSVSVRYQDTDPEKALRRELYRCAGIYLDIYRGVSAV